MTGRVDNVVVLHRHQQGTTTRVGRTKCVKEYAITLAIELQGPNTRHWNELLNKTHNASGIRKQLRREGLDC